MKDALYIWTIYDHPSDYPIGFIGRAFIITNEGYGPTYRIVTGKTLDEVRGKLPPGLTMLPRSLEDDPKIVESWL
jgi:hypothetical protein